MSLKDNFRYGTDAHAKLVQRVWERRRLSAKKMGQFHVKWDEADDSFRAYQPETTEMAARREQRKSGKHDYTTVTIPYTYAIAMTAHTYWSSVFLSRSPIYQLQGRHGEAQDSVQAFEAVLEYQSTVGRHLVPLFNWIFDMSKYGLGIVGTYWDKEESSISRVVEKPLMRGGIEILGKTESKVETQTVTKYEGNRVFNVRPYDWFPDPRVAITEFQSGEFCGRDTQVGWHEILDGQRTGKYFNVEALAKRINSGGYDESIQGSSRVEMPDVAGESVDSNVPGPGFVRLHEMTIRLIPATWGLSPVKRVEKWVFTIANGDMLIGAEPLGMYHDQFPFDIMEFGFGAHEFLKMGLPEIIQPLVDILSWLFNSHFYNVRKALNDVRVVDPSRVIMKDLTSPIERGIIRLKPEAYGSDVRTAIHQLQVGDMTQGHLRDASIIETMLQRISGVVDELMGISTGPDRESATGVRTRTGFAANRLKTTAEYNSSLGMQPLIAKLTSNTQQLMKTEQKFRLAGPNLLINAQNFVNVTPDLIAGQYDYIPVDGSLPVDRLAQANFFKELAIQIAQSDMLAQGWNLNELITHIMHLQGLKNVERFRIQVADPAAVQQQVGAGNLVPIGGRSGGGNATGTSGATL